MQAYKLFPVATRGTAAKVPIDPKKLFPTNAIQKEPYKQLKGRQ